MRRSFGGGVIIVALALGLTLPLWIERRDQTGRGELTLTQGGSMQGTHTGTSLLAPGYVNAGTPISPHGTDEAPLVWRSNPCESILDCKPCPPKLNPSFNASLLEGAILIYDNWFDERL